MKNEPKKLSLKEVADARARRMNIQHLQQIEGNPLDGEQIAMFEMFERERWNHDQRLEYILARARKSAAEQDG